MVRRQRKRQVSDRAAAGKLSGTVPEDAPLDLFLGGIRKFHAGVGKELHTIVLIGIVRGGDDHACLKIVLADQAGYSGGGDDTGKSDRRAGFGQALGKEGSDVRAGLARIHADQNAGGAVLVPQVLAESQTGGVKRRVVQGRSTRDSADAVSAEEFFGHEERTLTGCERDRAPDLALRNSLARGDWRQAERETKHAQSANSGKTRVALRLRRKTWACGAAGG